ncbi:MAG TPA: SDR family NAD(P)-dependent oxidoreductase, partial [Candidatus Rifleibacterium sp.]|nr:SDR family NAD(P)-dependent oxidoreductase [Candidatus Rifleibacterium sp.]
MNSSENTAAERPVAIVTGSARGIGLEIARAMGEAGYRVVLSDINEEGLAKAKAELENAKMIVATCKADVSKAEDAEKLTEAAVSAFGRIDVLVNNAGI